MAELRKIGSFPPPDKDVSRVLEYADEQFEAGDVSALALVIVHRDGSVSTKYSYQHNKFTMIGGLAKIQKELLEP